MPKPFVLSVLLFLATAPSAFAECAQICPFSNGVTSFQNQPPEMVISWPATDQWDLLEICESEYPELEEVLYEIAITIGGETTTSCARFARRAKDDAIIWVSSSRILEPSLVNDPVHGSYHPHSISFAFTKHGFLQWFTIEKNRFDPHQENDVWKIDLRSRKEVRKIRKERLEAHASH